MGYLKRGHPENSMTRIVPTWILLATALGGCTPGVQFKDDFDFRFDLRGVGGKDKLSTPYVEGTPVRITVTGVRDVTVLEVASSDDAVFRVDQVSRGTDDLTLDCTAVGPGSAELVVTKPSGKAIDSVPVEVGRPDRVELHAASALRRVDGDGAIEAPLVLRGGDAAFEVCYFDGADRLYGNDVLVLDADPALNARAETSWLGENREWLHVEPTAPCAEVGCGLTFSVGGQALAAPPMSVVEPSVVTAVQLDAPDESTAEEEQSLTVVARAENAAGERVYGAEFSWTYDTLPEDGEGDLFHYTYDSTRQPLPLDAEFEGLVATVDIRGQGSVGSSATSSCSSTGGASGLWAVVLAGGFGWARMRVRRTRTRGTSVHARRSGTAGALERGASRRA